MDTVFLLDDPCVLPHNKANLRDLIAETVLVILLKLNSNSQFFCPCNLEIWWMTSKNNRAPLLYYIKLCASFQIYRWIQTGVTVRKRSTRVEIGDILSLVTMKFDGWLGKQYGSSLHYIKICASFQSHRWIQSGVTVRKRSFRFKISNFLGRVTSKCGGRPWKTIGHLFFTTSSIVHHFVATGKFKLQLQSGNAQFG